jgi:hypothetical protein
VNEKLRERVKPWLSASVLVGIAALGVSLGQSVFRFGDYVRVQLSANAECCREFQSYRLEDSSQRRLWVDVIRKNEERLRELERQQVAFDARLDVLSTNANARPDPFTGTEGRELERRITALEDVADQSKR